MNKAEKKVIDRAITWFKRSKIKDPIVLKRLKMLCWDEGKFREMQLRATIVELISWRRKKRRSK